MAQPIQDVISFDIDTQKAIQATNTLVSNLKKLEQEFAILQKEGKETAAVEAQITAASQKLAAQTSQTTTSIKGQTAQVQALNNANATLSKSTNQAAETQTNLGKATRTAATSVARGATNIKSFGGAVALGAANLGNFLGIANLGGFAIGALTSVADKATVAFLAWLNPIDKVAEASKAVAAEFVKETAELDVLLGAINNNSVSREDQAKAIKLLNDRYGEYLGNIDLDKASSEQLLIIQQKLNDQILLNIVNKAKAEAGQKIIQESIERAIKLEEVKANAAKSIFSGTFLDLSPAIQTALQDANKTAANELNNLDANFQQVFDNVKSIFQNADLDFSQGANLKELTKDVDLNKKAVKAATSEYKVLEGSLTSLEAELSRIQKLINDQVQITDIDNIRILQAEYDRLAAKITEAKSIIEGIKPEPIKLIDVQTINVIDDAKRAVEQLDIAQVKAITNLEAERNLALTQATGDAIAQQKITEDFNARRLQVEKETNAQILAARLKVLQLQRTQMQLAGEEVAQIELEIAKINQDLVELNKPITVNVDAQPAQNQLQKLKTTILTIVDGFSSLSDQLFTFLQANTSRTIAQYDAAIAKQEEALNKLLSNQSTANVQQVKAEQDRLDALQQAREQAKERESAIIIAQIAANAALTVARAAAEGGGLASAFTIAAALTSLVFGFASARTAAEQSFHDGTMSVQRNGNPQGRDTVPVWVEEKESIFPAATTKKYYPALESIFYKRIPAEAINEFVKSYDGGSHQSDYIGFNHLEMPKIFLGGKNDMKKVEQLLSVIANKQSQPINITEKGIYKIAERNIENAQRQKSKFGK